MYKKTNEIVTSICGVVLFSFLIFSVFPYFAYMQIKNDPSRPSTRPHSSFLTTTEPFWNKFGGMTPCDPVTKEFGLLNRPFLLVYKYCFLTPQTHEFDLRLCLPTFLFTNFAKVKMLFFVPTDSIKHRIS